MSSSFTDHNPDLLWEHQARIEPSRVQLGHFVARLDIPWSETPFPMQGVLVNTADVKRWLEQHCAWVVVDLERSANKSPPLPSAPGPAVRTKRDPGDPSHPVHTLRRSPIDRGTMRTALKGYVSLDRQARRLIKVFADGGPLDAQTARVAVHELSRALDQNLAAMVWLTRIKQQDNYTAEHCINVALLSMGLAHALDWKQADVELAGLSGLLHDLGKMKVDPLILNKADKLTPDEFDHLKTHSMHGYELLRTDADVPAAVSLAVLEHHERPDGHGYPHGKRAGEFSRLASLVAVVDAYDAITSHRVYDAARSHHEALGILWQQRGKQFDREMVEVFIQFMGWVTPGTLVRLSSGEIAVVVQANMGQRLLPVVRVLHPTDTGYRPGDVLDLSTLAGPEGRPRVRIAQVLPDGAEGVDLRLLSTKMFD